MNVTSHNVLATDGRSAVGVAADQDTQQQRSTTQGDDEMSNWTNADLEQTVGHIADLSLKLGLIAEGERLALDIGSKTYGRAFRLHVTNVERSDGTRSSGHSTFGPAGPGGFLGWTKNEAGQSLAIMFDTLRAVAVVSGSKMEG